METVSNTQTVSNTTLLIIQSILDPFNATQQAISRHKICIDNPSHPYRILVSSNTIHDWERYFSYNVDCLYSKGYYRRDNILRVMSDIKFKQLPPIEGWFVFAGLIILFQMYGDGNHRTASYIYNKQTGLKFPSHQIDNIQYTYMENVALGSNEISQIIQWLLGVYYKNINETYMSIQDEPTYNHTISGKI